MAAGQVLCAKYVCKEIRGANYEVYNDKAVGVMALLAIIISLSGLIWYCYTLLRYCIIAVGIVIGCILFSKIYRIRRKVKCYILY